MSIEHFGFFVQLCAEIENSIYIFAIALVRAKIQYLHNYYSSQKLKKLYQNRIFKHGKY